MYFWHKFDLHGMPKILENTLREKFRGKTSFSREELFDFFRQYEPDLKEGTFGWRIYDLKKKNIIKPLKRGLYTISPKSKYKPAVSADLLKAGKQIIEQFSEAKYCLWDTAWLNEFSQHQSSRHILIIEIEKGFVESLYYHLKDTSQSELLPGELYVNPDEKDIDFYISESNRPVIIKNLITRSPTLSIIHNKITIAVPTLEKILVDLYAESKLFYFYQGPELSHIYENVLKNYSINFTKLFSYANRREKERSIKAFMKNQMHYLVKDIIDD